MHQLIVTSASGTDYLVGIFSNLTDAEHEATVYQRRWVATRIEPCQRIILVDLIHRWHTT